MAVVARAAATSIREMIFTEALLWGIPGGHRFCLSMTTGIRRSHLQWFPSFPEILGADLVESDSGMGKDSEWQ
jgi:hypothetical protein